MYALRPVTLAVALSYCFVITPAKSAEQLFKILGFYPDPVPIRNRDGRVLKSIAAGKLAMWHENTLALDPKTELLVLDLGDGKSFVYFATKDVKTERTDVHRPPPCDEIPEQVSMLGSSASGDIEC